MEQELTDAALPAAYDVFRLSKYKDTVQMLAGLCASFIRFVSSSDAPQRRLWLTHRGPAPRSVRNHVETQRIKALG